jgi:hypothetical protein
MSPLAIAALILLAAIIVAGAVTFRSWAYGYVADRVSLRRCFLVWLAALLAEGALLWWLGSRDQPPAAAWATVLIGLPLVPPAVYNFHNYAAVPAVRLITQSAAASAAWIAGMGSAAVLWPFLGAWGFAVPAVMAAVALCWYVRRDSSPRESLIAIAVIVALIASITGMVLLLEWLGVSVL